MKLLVYSWPDGSGCWVEVDEESDFTKFYFRPGHFLAIAKNGKFTTIVGMNPKMRGAIIELGGSSSTSRSCQRAAPIIVSNEEFDRVTGRIDLHQRKREQSVYLFDIGGLESESRTYWAGEDLLWRLEIECGFSRRTFNPENSKQFILDFFWEYGIVPERNAAEWMRRCVEFGKIEREELEIYRAMGVANPLLMGGEEARLFLSELVYSGADSND